MTFLFIYDIESSKAGNKRRLRLVKKALRAGLIRIQKSVFMGRLEAETAHKLMRYAKNSLNPETDQAVLMPLCREDLKRMQSAGNPLALKEALGQKKWVVI